MLARLLLPGALVLLLLLAAPPAVATHSSGENAHPTTWVDGDYVTDLHRDLLTFTINGTIGVRKIADPDTGTKVFASDIRAAYAAAPDQEAYLRGLRGRLQTEMNKTLVAMFPGKSPTYLLTPPIQEELATLTSGTGSGPSSSPVIFRTGIRVALSAAEAKLGAYGAQQVEAALNAGAEIRTERNFSAEPGHTNVFTLRPPPFASVAKNGTAAYTPPNGAPPGSFRTWVDAADVTAGSAVVGPTYSLALADLRQSPPSAESIVVATEVSILPFELDSTTCCKAGLPLQVGVTASVRAIGVESRLSGVTVPDAVKLPTAIWADALRLLHQRSVVSDAQLTEAETTIRNQVRTDIRNSFQSPTAEVTTTTSLRDGLGSDVSNPLDGTPAAMYGASAKVFYNIGSDSNTADAGLRAGAVVEFNVTLEEGADFQQTFRFILPAHLAFMNRTTPVNGASLTFDVPDAPLVGGKKLRNVTFVLGNATAERPASEVIRNRVVVTIPDMGGLPGTTVPLHLAISAEVESLDVPGRFPSVLPANVRLPFLGADALRLLRDRGVVKQQDLDNATRDLLKEVNATLLKSFPGGVSASGGFVPAALAAVAPDAWPVWFNVTAVAQHDIGEKPDRADAAFDAGAIVNTTFDLTSTKRQRTDYRIALPSGFVFFDGNAPGPATRSALVDATGQDTDKTESLSVRFGKDMARPSAADITVSIRIGIGKLADGGDSMPASVEVDAYFTSIDVKERFPTALPPNVDLPFLSADGFRILRGRDVIADSDLANASRDLGNDVKARLKEAFGDRVNVTAEFDATSFSGTGPIHLTARAAVLKDLGIPDPALRPKAGIIAEVILEAGAKVKQRINLTGLKDANLTYTVTLPETLAFRNVEGVDSWELRTLSLRLNGHGITEDVKQEILFDLVDPKAGSFLQQKAEIDISLDLQLDVELITAIQTQNADMVIALDALVTLGVIEVPPELAGQIPAEVSIRYIPADVLRKLWQLGVLNETAVKQIEDEFLKQVSEGLKGVAGKAVDVQGGLARAQFDEVVASPLGDRPVKLTAKATIRKPLAGGPPAGALQLAQIPLDLPLQSFQNLPTTYLVVLPKGLSVASARTDNAQDSTIEHGVREDGREWMKAKVLNGKTVTASMAVGVTSDLLIDKFLPWLILAGVIVVGLIALPVWGVVRLIRRGKGGGEGGEGGGEGA